MNIGIVGLGDMGKLYAREFSSIGHEVSGCDLPENIDRIKEEFGTRINIVNAEDICRESELIIYSVQAHNIHETVRQYGPLTRRGAIVAGQTSVKTPEIEAFEKYLPRETHIVTCHSLHGGSVSPVGQNLVLINHRSSREAYNLARETFETLGSRIIEISDYKVHDRITADTQAVTHIGFESMGSAWMNAGFYPWENPAYIGGIDNVKILMTLRIFGGKSHVYSGLAMLNPFAINQIGQYAKSEADIFRLMIKEDEKALRSRLKEASDLIFGNKNSPIMLEDKIMGDFNLGARNERKQNSHLSLLTMVDAWHKLRVNPYNNLICQTPLFKLRLLLNIYLEIMDFLKNP